MGVRIGLLAARADLAVEVAGAAARAGAALHTGAGWADMAGLDLVLVDVAAGARGLGDPGQVAPLMHDGGVGSVVVVCRAEEVAGAQTLAESLAARHVVELPAGAGWLARQLAPAGRSGVLAVLGAVGGVGASTVAIACAAAAGTEGSEPGSRSLLVDADPRSPGLDLPLGIAEDDGVRWPGVPDGRSPLDPESLRSALPTVGPVAVLTGALADPGPERIAAVTAVGRAVYARTVLDLGRGPVPAGVLSPPDTVALVVPATVAGVVAARRVRCELPVDDMLVLVRPTGWLPVSEVAAQLGPGPVLEVPRLSRAAELADCGDLLSGRTGRALRRLGAEVWASQR